MPAPSAPTPPLPHSKLILPHSFPGSLTCLCSLAPGSPSPDTHLPQSQLLGALSDGLPTSPPPDDSPSLKVFRCLVCQAFSTDSLELLLYHCSMGRSLPEAEWKEVAGDTHRCKLCCYGTQLKANFQLHLKTDKHAQKYQLAAHLREGGGAWARPLQCLWEMGLLMALSPPCTCAATSVTLSPTARRRCSCMPGGQPTKRTARSIR